MKKIAIFTSLCIASMILFNSCDPNSNEQFENLDNQGDHGDSEPESVLLLVKFTNDDYREQIIAEKIADLPITMRGSKPPVVEELIVGTIPYTDKLPNGYWIVNWRWGDYFIYQPSNILLPDKWERLEHWNQTWEVPKSSIPFKEYIEDFGFIRRRKIDAYLSINTDIQRDSELAISLYSRSWIIEQYVSEKNIPDNVKEHYFSTVYQQDSLHALYVQRLTEITDNGDFEKLYKTY